MTGIINRVPVGLLDLLDMKSRGQSPRELAGQVQGGIDLLPLYEIDLQRAAASVVVNVNAPGSTHGIQVPNDEIWHVLLHSVNASPGAGEAISVAPSYFSFLRLGGNFWTGAMGPPVSTGAVSTAASRADRDYWCGPGDQLGYQVLSITGTIDISTRVLYVPYRR